MKQIYQTLLQRYRFIAEKIMDEFAGFSSGIPGRVPELKVRTFIIHMDA